MTLKVLPTEFWMEIDLDPDWRGASQTLGNYEYTEITPVFNREGIYLDGDKCWVEIQGRAFKYSIEAFKFRLAVLDAEKYTDKQYKALQDICREGLATKEQYELKYRIEHVRSCRDSSRNARLFVMRNMP